MVTPKYRSVFTGAEIDEAIATMKANSQGGGTIVNDFNGGPSKIASAELAKILRNDLDNANTGENFKAKLQAIDDANLLTDIEYSKFLFSLPTSSFRGAFSNAADRDAALGSEYANYTGKEISFIADAGSSDGLSEFSIWDKINSQWVKIKLVNEAGGATVTVNATQQYTLFTYATNKYGSMKCLIQATNADKSLKQIQEVLITHVGTDSYTSIYNEVGNSTTLFTINSSINTSTGIVSLIVTAGSAQILLNGKREALL